MVLAVAGQAFLLSAWLSLSLLGPSPYLERPGLHLSIEVLIFLFLVNCHLDF